MVRLVSCLSPSFSCLIVQCVLLPASNVPRKQPQGFIVSSIAHIFLASRFTFGQVRLSHFLTRTNQLILCYTAPPGRCLPSSLRIRSPLPRKIIPIDVLRVFRRRVWPGPAQCANERVYLHDAEPGRDGACACFIWCVLPSYAVLAGTHHCHG